MEWIQKTNQNGGINPNAACAAHLCSSVGPGWCLGNICLTKGGCLRRNIK